MRRALLLVLGLTTAAAAAPASLGALKWRLVGPFRGGRVLAVAGVAGQPGVYYFGAAAGGVWKTSDGGGNWRPIFDGQPIASIGAIAVAPSDANVVYVGTGEACIRGNISFGDGVYRSSDGGATWRHLGLDDTRHIGRIVVSPRDPDTVLVAALGHAFGPNAERGVFRSTDGGKSWKKVLYRDDRTGAIDLALDPRDASVVYAALWQAQRSPWSLSSGGPGSGLYRSSDGGATWTRLAGNGLPKGLLGRIGIAVSPVEGRRVWAMIEAEEGGLYRSDDGGGHWQKVNDDDRYRQRAWYFSHIFADPRDLDTVWVGNTGLHRSRDGGKTFTLLPAPGGDHHALWIDPSDSRRVIDGNDNGATVSGDGGQTWTTQENQPTGQFYHVAADRRFPYRLYGAQQDRSSIAVASRGETWSGVISESDTYRVGPGEAGNVAPDPRDADTVYSNNENQIVRYDRKRNVTQDISIVPRDVSGKSAGALEHRFGWTEPLFLSPHDPDVLYTASEVVWRSADRGQTWRAISGDLTRNDKSKQRPSGGPITLDITSVEYYDTVFALAESPVSAGLLWAGTDDGLIHVTRDGGRAWKNVTPRGLPEWSMISMIEPSRFSDSAAYVAVDRHKLDDLRPYVYRTTDLGASWTALAGDLPVGAYVHAVREDPARRGLLYAATELGPFVSFDDGAHWHSLRLAMPVVPITDLLVVGDDLAASTNGRGFWILDDVTPLRQEAAAVTAGDAFLFAPAPTVRVRVAESVEHRTWLARNPSGGAHLDYWLRAAPASELRIEIVDAAGRHVRGFSSTASAKGEEQPPEWPDLEAAPDTLPVAAGANRFVWDLRYEPPVRIPGAFYTDLAPEGPVAPPGRYTVRLTLGGTKLEAPLELRLDPRLAGSEGAVASAFTLGLAVRDEMDLLHRTVNEIRAARGRCAALRPRLDPIEGELLQVKRKSSEGNLKFPVMLDDEYDVFRQLIDEDAAPTAAQVAEHERMAAKLKALVGRWQGLAKGCAGAAAK